MRIACKRAKLHPYRIDLIHVFAKLVQYTARRGGVEVGHGCGHDPLKELGVQPSGCLQCLASVDVPSKGLGHVSSSQLVVGRQDWTDLKCNQGQHRHGKDQRVAVQVWIIRYASVARLSISLSSTTLAETAAQVRTPSPPESKTSGSSLRKSLRTWQ